MKDSSSIGSSDESALIQLRADSVDANLAVGTDDNDESSMSESSLAAAEAFSWRNVASLSNSAASSPISGRSCWKT